MLLGLIMACVGGRGASEVDSGADAAFLLSVDEARVALPFTTQGQPVPSGLVTLRNLGTEASDEVVMTAIEGPFRLEGYEGRLEAGEERPYTVRFDGTSSEPGAWVGRLDVEVDGQRASVELVAVVGARDLPEAVWSAVDGGEATRVALQAVGGVQTWLRVPDGLADDDGVGLAAWIGSDAPEAALEALDMDAQARVAARNAVFVALGHAGAAPSGALLERDVLAILYRDGWITRPEVSGRAWFLEGAGAADAAGWVSDEADAVHLIEPSGAEPAEWAARAVGGGVLRVLATDAEPFREAFAAASIVTGDGLSDASLDAARVSVVASAAAEVGRSARHDRALQRLLRASGLPPLSTAAPELQYARAGAGMASLRWRSDVGSAAFRVQGSVDGTFFSTYTTTDDTAAEVSLAPWVFVERDVEGAERSALFAADGGDVWFVDASDRLARSDASRAGVPDATAPELLGAAGLSGSTFSIDALRDSEERIEAPCVFWRAGSAGAEDAPLDAWARALLDRHAAAGGRAVLTGARLARVADPAWLAQWGVASVEPARSDQVNGWSLGASDGASDAGDALTALDYTGRVLWTWADGSAAAVESERGVVVGFALEDLDAADRSAALPQLLGALCVEGGSDAR